VSAPFGCLLLLEDGGGLLQARAAVEVFEQIEQGLLLPAEEHGRVLHPSANGVRGEVIGATNPQGAAEGSIRNTIYKQWESLGLAAEPDTGDNAVHASASAFEGLAERANWLAKDVSGDPFGEALVRTGLPADTIGAWMQDPGVLFGGKRQSLFDLLEDLDSGPCLQKAADIFGQQEAPKESRHMASVGGA